MKEKILKNVSPFIFFLLMIAASVPGTAQQKEKNNNQEHLKRYSRVNTHSTRTNPAKSPNYSANVRTTSVNKKGNRGNYGQGNRNGNRFGNHRGNRGQNVRVYANRGRSYGHRAPVRRIGNPIGIRVQFLPADVIQFRQQGQVFFYSCGDFFTQGRSAYRTVLAPVGARIRTLPRRARSVRYGHDIFYKLDSILLAATVNNKGRVVYEVVGYA